MMKWENDLESGFEYAFEIAVLNGATPAVLDAMDAEWQTNHAPQHEHSCFHCARMSPSINELRSELAEYKASVLLGIDLLEWCTAIRQERDELRAALAAFKRKGEEKQ